MLNPPTENQSPRAESATRPEVAFTDERGDIINILDQPISHVAIITSQARSVRGNHYHPQDQQYMYVVSGSFESVSQDMRFEEPRPLVKQVFRAGDLVHTPAMVAHAYRYLEDTVFLNLTMDPRGTKQYEEHTIKVDLV